MFLAHPNLLFSQATAFPDPGLAASSLKMNHNLRTLEGLTAHMKTAAGFIAALDESGGSAPGTLTAYGIPESEFKTDGEIDSKIVFELAHKLRSRIVTSECFNAKQIVGVILFEDSVTREVNKKSFSEFLLDKGIPPIIKIDQGLCDASKGVRLMKPFSDFDSKLHLAQDNCILATKMRSVILEPNATGIKNVVEQQFAEGLRLSENGILPILEPERDIKCRDAAIADNYLTEAILEELDKLPETCNIMLKLSLPDLPGIYRNIINHPRVARVVALSGGHTLEEACRRLTKNSGMSASFSRALRKSLTREMSAEEFNAALRANISDIFEASVS